MTVEKRIDANSAVIRIPNEEVMSEFLVLVTEIAGIEGQGLQEMFQALTHKDINRFWIYTGTWLLPVRALWMPERMRIICFSWECA